MSSSSTTKRVEVKVDLGGDELGTISSQSSGNKSPAMLTLEVAGDDLNCKEDRITPVPTERSLMICWYTFRIASNLMYPHHQCRYEASTQDS
jgi:hypothetical protein